MSREISNMDDVIDSRDIITRLEELEEELEDLDFAQAAELATNGFLNPGAAVSESHTLHEPHDGPYTDEQIELLNEYASLRVFADDACEVRDWEYGETFIRDSYFQEYAEELAHDCAPSHELADLLDGTHDLGWPFTCMHIDWEQAARELKMDYTVYSFDGVDYWARA